VNYFYITLSLVEIVFRPVRGTPPSWQINPLETLIKKKKYDITYRNKVFYTRGITLACKKHTVHAQGLLRVFT
jgi:hypothetical protein